MAIPSRTMRSLAVRSKYGKPSTYEILDLPIPKITAPNEVLVKVHAASINTGDTQMVSGMFRLAMKNVEQVFSSRHIQCLADHEL